MNITERLQLIVDKLYSGNKAGFAKAIGIAPTSISNYLSKSRASKPSSDILESIVNNLPEINSDWLLTGKGEMLKAGRKNNIRNIHSTGTVSGAMITGDSNNVLVEKDQQTLLLENEVKYLKEIIAEKERFIQALLNK